MAIFAVGDVHGEYDCLQALLAKLRFGAGDTLWLTGDLVNRGKHSLKVLRFCQGLGDQVVSVLGNHDVFLLALYLGFETSKKVPRTLRKVLEAQDCDALMQWLAQRPFVHIDEQHQALMVHAGLPTDMSLDQVRQESQSLQAFFQDFAQLRPFITQRMMGNRPRSWDKAQDSYDAFRYLINCFTRLRYVDRVGRPRFKSSEAPPLLDEWGMPLVGKAQRVPWYAFPGHPVVGKQAVIFGHWATLAQQQLTEPKVYHIDTACAWGGSLTGLCVSGCEERGYAAFERISVACS